jgi:branched-chain amino acid transport system ATP-binding protein
MLEIHHLAASYGSSRVLFDVSLTVEAGRVTALLGRNGMGKTTTIRSLMGDLRGASGGIMFDGISILGWPPERVARLGIGLVPEGRQIFPNLDVRENLVATSRPGPWTLDRVLALFPRLGERLSSMGSQLSGGEQQMLAIGRALMTNPRLLILDEATEGLAPLICEEIWSVLASLKAEGQATLIVDKNIEALKKLADRLVIIEKGRTVWQASNSEFANAAELTQRYLGV